MKNRPFLEISKRIETLSAQLESKIREKHEFLLENSKLRKMIKSEIFSHQKAIEDFSEEMKRLDVGISFKSEGKSPENSLESTLNIQNKALSTKMSLLRGEIAQKAELLKKRQQDNRETEAKLSILLKEYNQLHRDFNELVPSTPKEQESSPVSCEDPAEITSLTGEIAKTKEIIDFSQKKSVYLETKLQVLEKSLVSLDFLEKERQSLESSNRTLKEKLSSRSGTSPSVENSGRLLGLVDEKKGRVSKKSAEMIKFEGYFKKLKNLNC